MARETVYVRSSGVDETVLGASSYQTRMLTVKFSQIYCSSGGAGTASKLETGRIRPGKVRA